MNSSSRNTFSLSQSVEEQTPLAGQSQESYPSVFWCFQLINTLFSLFVLIPVQLYYPLLSRTDPGDMATFLVGYRADLILGHLAYLKASRRLARRLFGESSVGLGLNDPRLCFFCFSPPLNSLTPKKEGKETINLRKIQKHLKNCLNRITSYVNVNFHMGLSPPYRQTCCYGDPICDHPAGEHIPRPCSCKAAFNYNCDVCGDMFCPLLPESYHRSGLQCK
jgi:hypothetical protein